MKINKGVLLFEMAVAASFLAFALTDASAANRWYTARTINGQTQPLSAGTDADWWVIAFARSGQWYYLNNSMEWTEFNGDLALCRPVYQGALFNLPSTTVMNGFQLARGTYDFWFAIDYSMDSVLNYPEGPYLSDMVTVLVE